MNLLKIISLALCLFLVSCKSVKQVGKLTMIANRNIDSKTDYVQLRSYMGGSKRELKRLKAKTIEEAIDKVVRNTPGGEFLKNVKVYLIGGTKYAVEGDVWGLAGQDFKGFKVGDKVQYTGSFGKTRKGSIVELKNEKQCIVKLEDGDVKEVYYTDLKKDY